MRETLEGMKDITILDASVNIKSTVSEENLNELAALADEIVASLNN